MAYGHIMHRHSGASRNLWRMVTLTVIPPQAGIYGVWSHSPSFRLPQPSFRRKPESMACGHIHHHSGSPQPSFRRKPESRACGHIHRHSGSPNRHSGASRNPRRAAHSPSFRRKPESTACGHIPRHSAASPNPRRMVTSFPVIPAQAGIYPCRLHYNSSRSRRRIPAFPEMTVIGASQR